jgi:hypothetical protein
MSNKSRVLALSLVAIHGADALRIAERGAANVQGMSPSKLAGWKLIIAEIQDIQKSA